MLLTVFPYPLVDFTCFLKRTKSYEFGARTQQEGRNFAVSVARSVFFLKCVHITAKIFVPTHTRTYSLPFMAAWILFIIWCLKKYGKVNNTSEFGSVSLHSYIQVVRMWSGGGGRGATQLIPLYSQSLGNLSSPRTETSSSPNPVSHVFVFLEH